MQLKNINRQLLINRMILCDMYAHLQYLKQGKRAADESGKEAVEYVYHNELKKHRKNIATLVEIQKELKMDRADQLEFERYVRQPSIFDASPIYLDDF